jgi:hypothetical protein
MPAITYSHDNRTVESGEGETILQTSLRLGISARNGFAITPHMQLQNLRNAMISEASCVAVISLSGTPFSNSSSPCANPASLCCTNAGV